MKILKMGTVEESLSTKHITLTGFYVEMENGEDIYSKESVEALKQASIEAGTFYFIP